MKLVVHCKREPFDIYVGRPTIYGNPFSHKDGTAAQYRVASVDEAIMRYAAWLNARRSLVVLVKRELVGKTLGCWCRPPEGFKGRLLCHGQILAGMANEIAPEEVE